MSENYESMVELAVQSAIGLLSNLSNEELNGLLESDDKLDETVVKELDHVRTLVVRRCVLNVFCFR